VNGQNTASKNTGEKLLQSASVKAACQARYSPIEVSGRAVKAKTVITYNFVK
jgi:hypothetical protein